MEAADIITRLLDQNERLIKEIVELSRVVAELRKSDPEPVYMEQSAFPLTVPEEEEDVRFLLDTGQIDKTQAEDLLKEVGFFNTSVEVPDF